MNTTFNAQHTAGVPDTWLRRADKVLTDLWAKLSPRSETHRPLHRSGSMTTCAPSEAGMARATAGLKGKSSLASLVKAEPTQVAGTCRNGLTSNDAGLKHARRRMRLAQDFDHMLANGFPRLALVTQPEPEFTLFISLTPTIAARCHE